jgi:molybdenum cofactor guanylyltransferase
MGRTKALIEIDGVPMATRVATALRSAGCVDVIAYGGDPRELAPLGLPVLPDRSPGSGPLGAVLGVLELFERYEADVAGVFVVACDLPALRGRSLAGMVDAVRARPGVDVIVARTSAVEPTCAIWFRTATAPLRHWFDEGERALHVAIDRLDSVEVDVDADALRNINTPEELGRYP